MKIIAVTLLVSNIILSQKIEIKNRNCTIAKDTNTVIINNTSMSEHQKNVLGTNLELASINPLTGFYRNGFCATDPHDSGIHVIAAVMTDAFLNFSKTHGNDLITPNHNYGFPGLKSGDIWCLCAKRWKEAFEANVAPPVILKATNKKALEYVALIELKKTELK